MPEPLLPFTDLASRHPGITPEIAAYYAQAAGVCLSQHHEPPSLFELRDETETMSVRLDWQPSSAAQFAAWANLTDTTEAGACACALAAVELLLGLVAIRRAEGLTGADYYLTAANPSHPTLRDLVRLEISGTHLNAQAVESRLRSKLRQVTQGQSELPALAAVVGFHVKQIVISKTGETL